MTRRLDELYLTWLYEQVADPKVASPSRTYWNLLHLLFTKEFTWTIPHDDNRLADGVALRYEFIDDLALEDVDPHWLEVGCSTLELILGLSRRLSFLAEGEPRDWFWHILNNTGLRYNDRTHIDPATVEEVLDRIINRTYSPDGSGGFFPLKHDEVDQRGVELWYQLNAYLLERD